MSRQPSGGRFLVPRGAACSLLCCATSTSPRVVASDHTPIGIPRNVKVHPTDCIFDTIDRKLEEVEWLLNYARNANKPIPVASAITTKKVNAPRQMASMRLLKHATSHQKTMKMEARCDPEQASAPYDKGVRKLTRSFLVVVVPTSSP
jgi:hypothetical protein